MQLQARHHRFTHSSAQNTLGRFQIPAHLGYRLAPLGHQESPLI